MANRCGSPSSPTSTRRPATWRARSSGSSPRRDYGRAEVAVFYRTNAQSRVLEDTLVRFDVPYQVIGGTKFYERAEIKDAIAYLSLLANPADAVSLLPRRQLSPARDRQHDPGPAALAREHHRADDLGGDASKSTRVPALGAAAVQGGLPLRRDDGLAPRARRAQRPRRRAAGGGDLRERLRSRRWRRSARSRPRGGSRTCSELIGVAGEFDANRELEGESRDQPAGGVPAADLAALRSGRAARRREPDHADDPAQRQGPGVPRRLHDRVPRRACSRIRARSRRATSRRSAGSATSRSPGRSSASTLTCARAPQPLRRNAELQHALALPRRDTGGAGRAQSTRRTGSAGGGDTCALGGPIARPEPRMPARRVPDRRRRRSRQFRRGRGDRTSRPATCSSSASPATALRRS